MITDAERIEQLEKDNRTIRDHLNKFSDDAMRMFEAIGGVEEAFSGDWTYWNETRDAALKDLFKAAAHFGRNIT